LGRGAGGGLGGVERAGMDDYISKPIDTRALHEAIARALDTAQSAARPAAQRA